MKFRPIETRIEYGGAIIDEREKEAIFRVINSQGGKRWTIGPESLAFEKELAEVAEVKRAVVTNSGSSALLIALQSLKIPKGNKVIVPATTFPTAFNAILQAGLVPWVVDVDNTLNLSYKAVEELIKEHPYIAAVLAVDIAGNPMDLIRLRKIVGDRKIILDNCLAKGTLIKTIYGEIPIENIKVGDYVLTRKGFKKVLRAIYRGKRKVITKLGIVATPDHPIITTKRNKHLKVLKPSDILYVWNQSSSHIEEKTIEDIQKQNKDTEEFISMMEKNFSIDKFGKTLSEKFKKDILSIIKMIIRLIISYRTLNPLHQNNTQKFTLENQEDFLLLRRILNGQELVLEDGTFQKKVKNGTKNIINGYGLLERKLKEYVKYAGKNIKHITHDQSSVQLNAKVKVEVYDLEVEGAHEFFANNILVKNCDGFGTLLVQKMIDSYADVSCISMHAAHIITMGEGGAVLTNDEKLANTCVKLREWGRAAGTDKPYNYDKLPKDYKSRYVYEEIGYNLKPLELQCAMGRIQLKKLDDFRYDRLVNHMKLRHVFKNTSFTVVMPDAVDSTPCWFSFAVMTEKRDKAMRVFEENNIETRTIFSGNILNHPAYKDVECLVYGELNMANRVLKEGMFISCHPSLDDDMIKFIGKVAKTI